MTKMLGLVILISVLGYAKTPVVDKKASPSTAKSTDHSPAARDQAGEQEARGPKEATNDEQEIKKILEEYRKAILTNDVSVMDRIEAPDFTITTPNGVYRNKALQLSQAPANQFEFINWDDIKIRMYGNVAVVTFHVLRKAKPTSAEKLRVLAVYVKQNGHWRNVAQQGTITSQ